MVETSPTRKKAKPSPLLLLNFPLTDLPKEVQAWIIELACRLPSSFSSSSLPLDSLPQRAQDPTIAGPLDSGSTGIDIDSPTTLALAIVSRSFHSQVDQVLYRHIRITRPSALLALQRTLVSRPQLGRIIKSVWVGPDDQLKSDWWPLRKNDIRGLDDGLPLAWLSSSLSWLREDHLIPRWARSGRWLARLHPSPIDCRGLAILNALKNAQKDLNVNLCRRSVDGSGGEVVESQWAIRVLEAQAALDLYLMEMRRLEDADDTFSGSWRSMPPTSERSVQEGVPAECHNASCNHYPPLELSVADLSTHPRIPASSSTGPHPPFILTRGQLLQHISRPGGPADHFDHPLLFLRSGVNMADLKQGGRARAGHRQIMLHGGLLDNSDSPFMMMGREASDQFNTALPGTATMGCLIGRVLAILKLAPRLTNLQLSGFLERAVCDARAPPTDILSSLSSLSLGPAPQRWSAPMIFHDGVFAKVKKLRLAGVLLLDEEVEALAKLPMLQHLKWTPGDDDGSELDMIRKALDGFLAHPIFCKSRNKIDQPPLTHHEPTNPTHSLPLIEVALSSSALTTLTSQASSPAVLETWLTGSPMPDSAAQRRLLLTESDLKRFDSTERDEGGFVVGWGEMYREGRGWWGREAGVDVERGEGSEGRGRQRLEDEPKLM